MKMKFSKAIYALIALSFVILFYSPAGFATKYYSYQSGNWNDALVWTTDSTGTTYVNAGGTIPVANDNVCILTGRTVIASQNIAGAGYIITINVGAILDLVSRSFGTGTITLNGKGRIRTSLISSSVAKLPSISGGTFLGIGGGTVEYYPNAGSCYIDDNIATYGSLIINMNTAAQIMVVRRNVTVYRSATITRGICQINDASTTKRTITVGGNLTVDANGKITVSTGNTNTNNYSIASVYLPPNGQFHAVYHQLNINGDFTNNGTVRFTNLTAPNYGEFASNGAVTVRFTGESNNTITLNGITDFYNMIVDKGTDQTYILTVFSSDVANFSLYGSNAVKRVYAAPFSLDNPEVRKALWIKNGTLKLTGSILIPSLAEGPVGPADQNGDYAIPLAGQLWLDGPDVSVYTTAANATGFPQAPVNSLGVSTNAECALSIFGTFRISDGYFSTRHSAGIIFWNTANSSSMVIVEGGVLKAS